MDCGDFQLTSVLAWSHIELLYFRYFNLTIYLRLHNNFLLPTMFNLNAPCQEFRSLCQWGPSLLIVWPYLLLFLSSVLQPQVSESAQCPFCWVLCTPPSRGGLLSSPPCAWELSMLTFAPTLPGQAFPDWSHLTGLLSTPYPHIFHLQMCGFVFFLVIYFAALLPKHWALWGEGLGSEGRDEICSLYPPGPYTEPSNTHNYLL